MKINCILTLMTCFTFFAACKKSVDFPNKNLEKIVGEWQWEQASGGFAGTTLTPASEGFTESLLFQKSGEFVRQRDSVQTQSYFFWFEEGNSIFTTETVYLLKLGSRDRSEINFTYSIDLDGDILYLYEECNDCFSYKYSRKP